jgi:hypothetical protein
MKSKDLRREVRFGSPLQRLLLNYTRTFLAVISQSVACSQHHSVEQRVARWLLTMDDYAGAREFLMDHESIAAMLGVVASVSRKLQTSCGKPRWWTTAAAASPFSTGGRWRRNRASAIGSSGANTRACMARCRAFCRGSEAGRCAATG